MGSVQALIDQCPNRLGGHGEPAVTMQDQLLMLAATLDPADQADVYGEGEYISRLETEVAQLFGFEHGVFMPSGTMAQQIALKIWADKKHNPLIAMHPTSHLETAEHLGYQHLHQLKRVQFGVPELIHARLLTPEDFVNLHETPSSVLLELPARPLGGQLHSWDDLLAIRAWCDEHDVALHMDGSRVWSATHYYQKSLAEIGALFDSVYVSFYKDLGGLCGCLLMGPEDFVAESRVWQRRHGGNLYTQFPFVASAKHGLETRLPQMVDWVIRAQSLATIMNEVEGVQTNPQLPQSNIFQLYLRGEADDLVARHDDLAAATGTYLFSRLSKASMPGYSMTEVHCWENAMKFDDKGLAEFLSRLV
jgi:threonine aldolase